MAYQLRSRGDPVSTESQEQTDTPGEHLTEYQVTTPSHVEIISSQLSTIQSVATATAEANRVLVASDISTKPDVETYPQLDIQGPTRPDPDLDSAPLTVQPSLAEEVGPSSTVSASRDDISTANETTQLYDTINSLLLLSKHDRQEVKQTTTGDITQYSYFQPQKKPNLMNLVLLPMLLPAICSSTRSPAKQGLADLGVLV